MAKDDDYQPVNGKAAATEDLFLREGVTSGEEKDLEAITRDANTSHEEELFLQNLHMGTERPTPIVSEHAREGGAPLPSEAGVNGRSSDNPAEPADKTLEALAPAEEESAGEAAVREEQVSGSAGSPNDSPEPVLVEQMEISQPSVEGRQVAQEEGSRAPVQPPWQPGAETRVSPEIAEEAPAESEEAEPREESAGHRPIDITLSQSEIPEDLQAGEVVAVLGAEDQDGDESFEFALVEDPSGLFDIVGDQLLLREGAHLDYETADHHVLTLQVTDRYGNHFTKKVNIAVSDVNEAPVAGDDVVGSVSEGAGRLHGQLQASDEDIGDTLHFAVSTGAHAPAGFELNEDGSWSFDPTNAAYDHLAVGDSQVLTIPVTVTDDQGATDTMQIQLTVTGTNDGPVAGADIRTSVAEGAAAISGQLSASDVDDGASLTFSVSEGASAPAGFVLNEDSSWSFDPADPAYDHLAVGDSQILTIPVTVTDDQGATDTLQIQLTVTGTNDGPVAGADVSQSVAEGAAAISGQLSASDVDDGASLTFSVSEGASAPAGFTLNEDGSWSFDPADSAYDHLGAGDSTVLTVPVTVTDDQGAIDTQQIRITVQGTNDAPVAGADVSQSVAEDAAAISGRLTSSDVDDGAKATYSISEGHSAPAGFTLNEDGSWSFDPADAAYDHLAAGDSQTLTIPVTVTDDQGATDTMQIQLTVTGTNDGPVAGTDVTTSVNEGAAEISGQLSASDVDDGASVTFSITEGHSAPAGFTLNEDGSWSFDPADPAYDHLAEGDSQVLTVPVTVTDDQGATDTMQVKLTVTGTNDGPVAGADVAASVDEGAAAISGQLTASDVDDDSSVTFNITEGHSAPAGFTLNEDGSWSFDPSNAAYDHLAEGDSQVLSIPVTVTDDQGATDTLQIQLILTGTNDGPVAGADVSASVDEGAAAISGQLTASDVDDGATLTFSISEGRSAPAGFTLNEDGSWSFDPSNAAYDHLAAGDSQTLTVPVTVTDDQGATDTMQIQLTVTGTNDGPVAGADVTASVEEGESSISGQLKASDADDGATVSFSITPGSEAPAGFTLNEEGSWSFDPADAAYDHLAAGDSQVLTVPVTVTDDQGATDTQQIRITVRGTNDGPVAVDDSGLSITGATDLSSIDLGDMVNGAGSGVTVTGLYRAGSDVNVLDGIEDKLVTTNAHHLGDYWPDSANQTGYNYVGENGWFSEHGITDIGNGFDGGIVTFSDGTAGIVDFVSDGAGTSEQAYIYYKPYEGLFDPGITTREDTAVTLKASDLLTNDSDVDGDTLTITSVQDAEHGTVSMTDDGEITFTPDENYHGEASFTYTVSDGHGGTSTGTVTLNVDAVNDRVSLVTDGNAAANTVAENAANGTEVGITASASDVDGEAVTYAIVDADGNPVTDGPFTVDPETGAVTVRDGSQLDYETATSHEIHIKATSEDGTGSVQSFTVDLQDVADNRAPDAVDDTGFSPASATLSGEMSFDEGVPDAQRGSVRFEGDGQVGDAADFSSAKVAMSGLDLNSESGAQTTVSMWVKADPSGSWEMIAGSDRYDLAFNNGKLGFNTARGDHFAADATEFSDGEWHHVVATFTNGDVHQNRLYVDGEAKVLSQVRGQPDASHANIDSSGGTLYFGSWGANDNYRFSGSMDEVKVFNGALSEGEVAELYEIEAGHDKWDGGVTGVENHVVTIDPSTLLANDSDPDGDALTITAVGDAEHGSVELVDGKIVFTPEDGYQGEASFRYTVSDGKGGSDTATVEVSLAPNSDPVVVSEGKLTPQHATLAGEMNFDEGMPAAQRGSVRVEGDGQVGDAADFSSAKVAMSGMDLSGDVGAQTTVSMWVKADPSGSWEMVAGSKYYDLAFSDGRLGFNTARGDHFAADASEFSDGEWHHVVATFTNGDVHKNQLYVDGEAKVLSQVRGQPDASHANIDSSGGTLYFGSWGGNDNYRFSGSMDEVKVFNGALNEAEVARLYEIESQGAEWDSVSDMVAAEDTAFTVSAADLLANDSDAEGDALSILSVQDAEHGTVSMTDDGVITFTPDENYHGEAQFSYTVSDGHGGTSTGTVTLNVDAVNDSVSLVSDADATANTVAENAANGTEVGITASATDVDGEAVTYAIVDADGNPVEDGPFTVDPETGVVTVRDASQLDYESATSHQIHIKATSEDGTSSVQSFTVDLTDVNEAPAASGDSGATNEDSAITIDVLSNDSDPDGDTLSITEIAGQDVTGGQAATITDDAGNVLGSARLTDDGKIRFTPAENYHGEASFTYTVSDGQAGTDTARVTLEVDAVNDSVSVVTDTNTSANTVAENAANGTEVGITASASDVDGEAVSFSIVDADGNPVEDGPFTVDPETGVVTVRDGGQLDYESATSQEIHIKATSEDGTSSVQSFTVNVSDVDENRIPDANDDAVRSGTGQALVSEDFENGVEGWSDNSVTRSDGNATDFLGRFGGTGGDEAVAKTYDFGKENAGKGVHIEFDMYEIDSWDDEQFKVFINGDEASSEYLSHYGRTWSRLATDEQDGGREIDNIGSSGRYWLDHDEVHRYSLEGRLDENGQLRLGFGSTLDQGLNDESWGIDNIEIRAGGDWNEALSTDEDTAITIDVLSNDSDPDGDSLSITEIAGQDVTGGQAATITDDAGNVLGSARLTDDGKIRFTPAENYHGEASFTYTVSDGKGGTDTARVTLNVDAVNDSVSVVTDTNAAANTVAENAANGTEVGITASATDVDGEAVTYAIVDADGNPVDNSPFTVDPETGVVTVRDASQLDYESASSHQIHIKATSEDGTSSVQSFTVNLTDVNEAPAASDDSGATNEDSAITIDVLSNDSDPDGDTLSITEIAGQDVTGGQAATITDDAGNVLGSAQLTEDGRVQFTPGETLQQMDDGESQDVGFSYTISDGQGGSDTANVNLTVTGSDDTPVLTIDHDATLETLENSHLAGSVNTTVDAHGAAVAYEIVGGADGDLFTVDDQGALHFKQTPDFEQAADAGADNVYEVQVRASSGDASETIAVRVQVHDQNERGHYQTTIEQGDGQAGRWDSDIKGSKHDDRIIVGDDNGSIDAGDGNDHVTVRDADPTQWHKLDTGKGDDRLEAGDHWVKVDTDKGDDDVIIGDSDSTRWAKLDAGDGNDRLVAGDDWDYVDSGKGDDLVNVGDADTSSGSRIRTDKGDDRVYAGDHWDRVETGDGNDQVRVGNADDAYYSKIDTGKGDDQITAGDNWSHIVAGNGDDQVKAGDADSRQFTFVDTGYGNDRVTLGDGWDKIDTGKGDDLLTAGEGSTRIETRDGDDQIEAGDAGSGFAKVDAGDGNDQVTVGDDWDYVELGKGHDQLHVGNADNTAYAKINAGDGNDQVTAGDGWDEIHTGDGNDVVSAGDGSVRVDAGKGDDQVVVGNAGSGHAKIDAGSGDDRITAGDGWDEIHTGDGSDVVSVGDGSVRIDAGKGDDRVEVGDAGSGYAKIDVGDGDDTITAGNDWDRIDAGDGNDTVQTGSGDVWGGSGDDTLVYEPLGGDVHFHGGNGGGWTDVIDLSRALEQADDPDNPWTITVDGQQVEFDLATHALALDPDTAGSIDLGDGSHLLFDGIEKIEW